MDMLGTVKARLDKISPPYEVVVSHEDGMWVGVCDALGLVTEAETYEALTERAWEIAPDLALANA